jgi:hypothetical protein
MRSVVSASRAGRPGPSPAVGPPPPDEVAVPAKQCLRRDHERGPPVPGEHPARRGEEHPIPVFELRSADGSAEHPHLVAQNCVLELELMDPSAPAQESDQPNEQEVDDRPQGAGDATCLPRSRRELSFGAPQAREEVLPVGNGAILYRRLLEAAGTGVEFASRRRLTRRRQRSWSWPSPALSGRRRIGRSRWYRST